MAIFVFLAEKVKEGVDFLLIKYFFNVLKSVIDKGDNT